MFRLNTGAGYNSEEKKKRREIRYIIPFDGQTMHFVSIAAPFAKAEKKSWW